MRFRCLACKKLLGVSQAKVGQSISCPICGTKQVVPPPRVEDIDELETASSGIWAAEEKSVTSATAEFPSLLVEELNFDDEDDVKREAVPAPSSSSSPSRPAPLPDLGAIFPAVQVDPLSIRPQAPPAPAPAAPLPDETMPRPRARDVVMPRTVMIAWSLFMLLALALAFLSGLLTGHFLWRPAEILESSRFDRPEWTIAPDPLFYDQPGVGWVDRSQGPSLSHRNGGAGPHSTPPPSNPPAVFL